MEPREDSWVEYRRLILMELERLNIALLALASKMDVFRDQEVSSLKVDVAMLKVRASLLGGAAGAIGGAIVGAVVAKFIH